MMLMRAIVYDDAVDAHVDDAHDADACDEDNYHE